MKLFISSDMEGVTGVTAWEDVRKGTSSYEYFREQMTNEISAICESAKKLGYTDILVKDAHSTARNILIDKLPSGVKLFSGWAKDPFTMMSGLDNSFDAVFFTGYHAGAFFDGNPLAHTMSSERIFYFKINDEYVSEFLLNSYIAAYFEVPIVGIAGDERICNYAKKVVPNITPMPVKKGIGSGVISLTSNDALNMISNKTTEALNNDLSLCLLDLPEYFNCELCFRDLSLAHKASFYKGAVKKDAQTVLFETADFYEVLRFFFFV